MEQTDVEKLIGELELAVDRLRSLYEQYFVGIEKIEPGVPRKDVDRRIYVLRKEQIRNTALRFRFQMVIQRYNTYQTHWQRICREIENGTYKRHMMRAQRRFGSSQPPRRRSSVAPPPLVPPELVRPEPGAPLAADLAAQLAELDRDFAAPVAALPRIDPVPRPTVFAAPGAPRPGVSAAPPPVWKRSIPIPVSQAAAPPLPSRNVAPPPAASLAPRAAPVAPAVPAAPAPEIPEQRLRQLYSELVETKRRQNESTAAITYQSVAKSLLESKQRLHKKHGKEVDFEVTVKDGKAVLRPILK